MPQYCSSSYTNKTEFKTFICHDDFYTGSMTQKLTMVCDENPL